MTNERIKEENQRRVLEKAMELCAEKGLKQMSLNQLAATMKQKAYGELDGVKDGSINPEIVENEHNFRTLAVVYRGFYSRIAMICADDTMSRHYAPEQLIEDYLKQVYRVIAMEETMIQRGGNDYEV